MPDDPRPGDRFFGRYVEVCRQLRTLVEAKYAFQVQIYRELSNEPAGFSWCDLLVPAIPFVGSGRWGAVNRWDPPVSEVGGPLGRR